MKLQRERRLSASHLLASSETTLTACSRRTGASVRSHAGSAGLLERRRNAKDLSCLRTQKQRGEICKSNSDADHQSVISVRLSCKGVILDLIASIQVTPNYIDDGFACGVYTLGTRVEERGKQSPLSFPHLVVVRMFLQLRRVGVARLQPVLQ